MKKKSPLFAVLILAAIPIAVFASGGAGGTDENTTKVMARFVLQLGVIVMIARLIGLFTQNVKLPVPAVLIEVLAGVLIGPYLLGSLPIPGFPGGLFPIASSTGIPVSPELYGIATIASLIMLFSAGLETDLPLLLKFSFVGLLVGLCGVIFPFAAAATTASFFFKLPFSDPGVLFLGVICTATSVGITARILSEKRKMDTPEGVTILAAAVIDDVLGIIALTVVSSIIVATTLSGGSAPGAWTSSAWVIGEAIAVWLGFTAAGIIFAGPLSRMLKKMFKSSISCISIFSLGIAFILSGVFEMAGLAMIIGAYIVGLSLSKTDLTNTMRAALDLLHNFFVPIFFIVMGMLVNPFTFTSKKALIFGAIYTAVATLTKVFGCGVPPLFMNFNRLGALRIGVGMVPRGEVALIIAGIGLTSGIITQDLFGAGVFMTLATSFIAPPLVSVLFSGSKKGTRKEISIRHTVSTNFNVASREMTELLEHRVAKAFQIEGFFIYSMNVDESVVYHLRKNDTLITMHSVQTGLEFESDEWDVAFINTVVYEALLELNGIITCTQSLIKPESLLQGLKDATQTQQRARTLARRAEEEIRRALSPDSIIPQLAAGTKQGVIEELVDVLITGRLIKAQDRDSVVNTVIKREMAMSTGIQHGIATPHARTDAVRKTTIAVGISQNGVNYQSLDGEAAKIIVLILSPQSAESSHLQLLANAAVLLNCEETREKMMRCGTRGEIYEVINAWLGT